MPGKEVINKAPLFQWMLEGGDLLITVDTSVVGVDIPPQLQEQKLVNFILGYKPTPKMVFDEWGVSASMRFSSKLFTCRFPWESLRAISSDVAVIQFRDMVEKESDTPTVVGKAPLPTPPKGDGKKERSHLRVIK